MGKRGPKPKFSRSNVAQTAFDLALVSGLETLSLTRIARELSTSGSALYRYFPSKTQLLEAMRPFAANRAQHALILRQPHQLPAHTDMRITALSRLLIHIDQWHFFMRNDPVSYQLTLPTLRRAIDDAVARELLAPLCRSFEHAARVATLRPGCSDTRALVLVNAMAGISTCENENINSQLIDTLLIGWGASQALLDAVKPVDTSAWNA